MDIGAVSNPVIYRMNWSFWDAPSVRTGEIRLASGRIQVSVPGRS